MTSRSLESGTVIKVRTANIHPNEPAVPTDFMDYLSTTSIFTFANEQELVNHEIGKASPIARYLTTYFLARDPSLQGDFADELRRLVEHLAAALGVKVTQIDVDVPKPQITWPKLPKLELCEGTTASVNGLPFAKVDSGYTVPIGFRPPQPFHASAPSSEDVPRESRQFIAARASSASTAQLAKGETHASDPFAGGRRSRGPPGQCRAKLIRDAGLVCDHLFETLEVGHHRSLVDHSDLADDWRTIRENARVVRPYDI